MDAGFCLRLFAYCIKSALHWLKLNAARMQGREEVVLARMAYPLNTLPFIFSALSYLATYHSYP